MKKHILGILAAVCLTLVLTPAVRAVNIVNYPVTGGSIQIDTDTGTVTDCDESVTEATIPAKVGDCKVTSIGREAFFQSRLTSVTIPNSVTSIGISAFNSCSNLTSVTIPNSVTSIGDDAFSYCDRLTSVTIPNSVTSIGDGAFFSCSNLTSVTIPNSVTSIGNSVFSLCSNLTSVTIPNSVTSIGVCAFSSCDSLTSVTIPNSVTSIGGWAFEDCSSLTSVTIPNSVTFIGGGAFDGCFKLTHVYYDGTQKEYETKLSLNIDTNNNDEFLNATFHFKDDTSPDPTPTLPNTAANDNTALHGTIFLLLSALTLTVWTLGRKKKDKQTNK